MALAARQRAGGGGGGAQSRSRSQDGGDRGSLRASSGTESATGSEEEAAEGYRKGVARMMYQFEFVAAVAR